MLLKLQGSISVGLTERTNIIMNSAPEMNGDPSIKKQVVVLSKLYAKLLLEELSKLLEQLENANFINGLSEHHLELIKVVFNEHFQRIHGSPLSYTASSHALMNEKLLQIARIIDRETQGQVLFLKLLILTLSEEAAREYSTDNFRFKNVVLSADGQSITPVDVVKNKAAFERLPPETQEQVFSQSPSAKALHLAKSQSGEFSVSRLSGGTPQSTQISIAGAASDVESDPISDEESCEIALDLSLLDATAPPVVLVNTADLSLLKARLSPYIKDIFSDKQELLSFMVDYLPDHEEWAHLMDILGEEVLNKCFPPQSGLFSGALFAKSAPVVAVSPNDHYLAHWFCVNAAYEIQREHVSDKWFFQDAACGKTAKLDAAKSILNLIVKGHSFDDIYAELKKLDQSFFQSLTTGRLGKLNASFLACAEEQYRLQQSAICFGK